MHFLPLVILYLATTVYADDYKELLTLRQTLDGKLITTFSFTTFLSHNDFPTASFASYTLFPSSLGEILRKDSVTEMHMSLNSGKWDYLKWGYEPNVGSGGEVWSWMTGDEESVSARWTSLQNSLGGLFCSSISPRKHPNWKGVTYPSLTYPPEGLLRSPFPLLHTNATSAHQLRLSILPSERLCTENLTPFLKLLPCNRRAGIAQLLNPHALVSADWHGIGVHVTQTPSGMNLNMAVRSVFDPIRTKNSGKADWSLESIFQRKVTRKCPAASSTQIKLHEPYHQGRFLHGAESVQIEVQGESKIKTIDLPGDLDNWELGYRYPEGQFDHAQALALIDSQPVSSPLLISRKLTSPYGNGIQTRRTLTIEIDNPHDHQLDIIYTEFVPWYLNLFLHTLVVEGGASHRIYTYTPSAHPLISELSSETENRPPTHLSLLLGLRPNSTISLSLDVEFAFLKYTSFVPDAQRGVDIPGSIVRILSTDSLDSQPIEKEVSRNMRIYTQPLLISLPTPDFSMPYNVIVMTSTVMAFMFANTFNMLVRKCIWIKLP